MRAPGTSASLVLLPPAAIAVAVVAPWLLLPVLLLGAGFGLHALMTKGQVDRAREQARAADDAARAAALAELNRLKSEFISVASHELRTPMTTIMGFSELLLEHDTPPETRQRWIAFINKESCQLSALIDDMLDVSRIEAGGVGLHRRAVDLRAAVDEVLAPLAADAPRHTLSADLAPAACQLQADPEKLRQILANLIGNAIKYSPNGGKVGVTARREGDRVSLAVSDQGVGIASEQQERIFERFQRLDCPETRGVRGTGLGLYIVRHLVELHGGTVEVESELGRGSTFRVTLRG